MSITAEAKRAKSISSYLAASTTELKNSALKAIAESLDAKRSEIVAANKIDLERSEKEKLASPLLKRLAFGDKKIDEVISGIEGLIALDDPVGKTQMATELDQGLELFRVSAPIGVIGVIFESRPDALVQISSLCLKSGNAVLLKGGSEAKETNRILADIINSAAVHAGVADGWLTLIETRSEVSEMLALDESIDLIIPRGSNEFVRYIMENSNIPVLGHADGICHTYIDANADLDLALKVTVDAKTQYVAVCNATETVLVHKNVAEAFLPQLKARFDEKSVVINGDAKVQAIIECKLATDETWKNEYLDYEVSIKLVDSLDEAIEHINRYGSGHTDSIITKEKAEAAKFMSLVDSGNVFWNVSTRFSDGFVYGFGAEVGISTNKIHARGPVGLEGLLIYKYKLIGNGHIKEDYSKGTKQFTHKKLDKECSI